MSVNSMQKEPTFTKEQLITASKASKHFGELRKKAQVNPMFITDNGDIDTVVLGYKFFANMYQRLSELEELEEARILTQRIEELERDPSIGVSWKSAKRTGRVDE